MIKSVSDLRDLGTLMKRSESAPVAGQAAQSSHPTKAGEIVLQRTIEVHCWHVVGRVARAVKRPELLPVLLRAREAQSTNERDVAEHLLREAQGRQVVARRLLDIEVSLRLLEQREREYVLTDEGRRVLESEQVFVPEEGTWTVWASDDPMLPTPVIRLEKWNEPSALAETGNKDKRDEAGSRANRMKRLPSWLTDPLRDQWLSVLMAEKGRGEARLETIEKQGEAIGKVELRVRWNVSSAQTVLTGSLDGKPVDHRLDPPGRKKDEVWRELLQGERLWERWDKTESVLRFRFDESKPEERQSMQADLTFNRPKITDVGVFDPCRVTGVRLRARSTEDAEHWARWRLMERVGEFATQERFARWINEASEPFAEFAPSMPTRAVLAHEAWEGRGSRPAPRGWYLMAAEDWGL